MSRDELDVVIEGRGDRPYAGPLVLMRVPCVHEVEEIRTRASEIAADRNEDVRSMGGCTVSRDEPIERVGRRTAGHRAEGPIALAVAPRHPVREDAGTVRRAPVEVEAGLKEIRRERSLLWRLETERP